MADRNRVQVFFEAVMNNFTNEIDSALYDMERQFGGSGERAGGLFEAGFAGAIAAVTAEAINMAGEVGNKIMSAMFIDPVTATAGFEKQMDNIFALAGLSADATADMKALSDAAIAVGENTALSASEGADALEYMAQAGWKTEQMTVALEHVANLAIASGEDLGLVSDIVTSGMTAMGMAADEAKRFSDVLTTASAASNASVAELGETLKYIAPVAGAMGYNIEDVATAAGLLANQGISASQAGTSLRAMLLGFTNATGEAQSVMDEYDISLTDESGKLKTLSGFIEDVRASLSGLTKEEQTSVASKIVGQEALSGFLALVNATETDYNNLTNAIKNSTDSAKNMADMMADNVIGRLDSISSKWETWQLKIGNKILPQVSRMLDALLSQMDKLSNTGAIDRLADAIGGIAESGMDWLIGQIDKLPGYINTATNAIVWLRDNIGSVIQTAQTGFGIIMQIQIVKWIFGINTAVQALRTQVSALFTLLAKHPILLVVAAVTTLITQLLIAKAETASWGDAWNLMWLKAWTALVVFARGFELLVLELYNFLADVFKGNPIGDFFQRGADGAKRAVDDMSAYIDGLNAKMNALKSNTVTTSVSGEDFDAKAQWYRDYYGGKASASVPVNNIPDSLSYAPVSGGAASYGGGSSSARAKTPIEITEDALDDIDDKFSHELGVIESRINLAERKGDGNAFESSNNNYMDVLREKLDAVMALSTENLIEGQRNIIETVANELRIEIMDAADNVRSGIDGLVGEFNKPSELGELTKYRNDIFNSNNLTANRNISLGGMNMQVSVNGLDKNAADKVVKQSRNLFDMVMRDTADYMMKDVKQGAQGLDVYNT